MVTDAMRQFRVKFAADMERRNFVEEDFYKKIEFTDEVENFLV